MTKSLRLTAYGIALLSATATAMAAMPETADAANTCRMGVEQPYYNGAMVGTGSWSTCYAGSHFTIVLREDRRFWPDRTIRTAHGAGISGSKTLTYPCGTDFDPIKVFVEIRHGGKKVQSARAVLPCA